MLEGLRFSMPFLPLSHLPAIKFNLAMITLIYKDRFVNLHPHPPTTKFAALVTRLEVLLKGSDKHLEFR